MTSDTLSIRRSITGRLLAGLTLASSCLLAPGALAEQADAPAPAPSLQSAADTLPAAQNIHLRYGVFIHGYRALGADADYVLQPWGYGVETHLYTVGLASWFLTLNLLSSAQGHFNGDNVAPVSFSNSGFAHGEEEKAHIDFDLTGPHVAVFLPVDKQREPLPAAELKQSVDMLSFLVALTHRMTLKQDCTFSRPVFDGIRLSYLDVHGPSQTTLPKDHGSYFRGDALKCDFTGRQIGGFSIGTRFKAAQSSPHKGTVWFVHDPQGGFVPARIEFDHYKMGQILVVLQAAPKVSAVTHTQTR
ncbi:hypothetical protein GM608_04300 [Bombella sp. ESL0380]|uniref:DUF3108 domain-containing protein n=1 Tax=Bombella sp. ESL0380 TaxID=2676444 RepID=UPI00139C9FC3|nr:hypothetical protein [Bombella sp. ESL0380]